VNGVSVDTRDQILAAASDLFAERGFEQTSLREIAARVGITKAALYYHFPSKADLFEALVAPAFEGIRDVLVEWERAEGDIERWQAALERLIDWMLDQQQLFVLIDRNIEAIDALSQQSEHFDAHRDFHDRVARLLDDPSRPLVDRLRVVSAIGAAAAMFTLGGRFPADADTLEVRAVLLGIVRAVLVAEPVAEVPRPAASSAV
jgi:AcrR family transcriptional regulator